MNDGTIENTKMLAGKPLTYRWTAKDGEIRLSIRYGTAFFLAAWYPENPEQCR